MLIGHWEIPGGLLVMPAFIVVICFLLVWSWYYYSKQEGEMRRLAASRGWQFLGKDPLGLRLSLDEVESHRKWKPENIILVEGHPHKVYLFNYQANDYSRRAAPELGTACLGEHSRSQIANLVTIDPRPPFIDKFVENLGDDWVGVGGPEFRQRFLVRSERPGTATAAVTSGVEEVVLLRRASSLKWNRVWISGKHVLVTVTYRLKPEDWDELIGITKRLRTALR